MTTNPLDEIDERVKGDRVCQQPECALEVCVIGKDRAKLVAALRAVEAVHVMSCELSVSNCDKGESCPLACCGPCGETWPCPTITAIREALN